MSSSETSDDENSALLREAVDTQFMQDDMFTPKPTPANKLSQESQHTNHDNTDHQLEKLNQPSLRPNTDKDDQFNMLGVTPQFQKYVAKQLSVLLDEKLRKKFTKNGEINNLPRKRKKGGIKLFKDSKKYVKIAETEKVKIRKPVSSESDNEGKLSEVSVNPDDILNKKDVENWATRSRAPIFKYKKSENGTLTSLD